MEDKKTSLKVYLALAIGILALGFSAIFVRWANAPGAVSSFFRVATATIIMAFPFLRQAKSHPLPKEGVRYAILGGIFFACDLGSWATGVMMGEATNPTLLANTAPLWVGIGAMIFFHERKGFLFWLGLTIALIGASFNLGVDLTRSTSIGMGTLLGLLSGFFYAGYLLLTQKGRESLDSLSYFWIAAASSTLVLMLYILLAGYPLSGYPLKTYLILLAFGLCVQVIGWLSLNYAQGHLPASTVSPTLLSQPVLTALFAWLLLGENLRLSQGLSGIAVLAGVYLVHRSGKNLNRGSG